MTQRRPEQLAAYCVDGDITSLAACLVLPLPSVLDAVALRSGAVWLAPGFLQDAVQTAALTIAAYGTALMDRHAPRRVHVVATHDQIRL